MLGKKEMVTDVTSKMKNGKDARPSGLRSERVKSIGKAGFPL